MSSNIRDRFNRQKPPRKVKVDQTDVQLIENFAHKIWQIANDSLEEGADACDCCGTKRFENYSEKILASKVRGAAEKLMNVAEELSRHIERGYPSEKVETDG